MPQKNCLCQEVSYIGCFKPYLFFFIIALFFLPCCATKHEKIFIQNLHFEIIVIVSSKTKQTVGEVKRSSCTTWLRDEVSIPFLFCVASLAEAQRLEDRWRCGRDCWTRLLLPGCIWTNLLGVSQHQQGLTDCKCFLLTYSCYHLFCL